MKKLPRNRKPAVANKEGDDSKNFFLEIIGEHARSVGHSNIISNLQARSAKKIRKNFLRIEQTEEHENNKYLEITSRMIQTVCY